VKASSISPNQGDVGRSGGEGIGGGGEGAQHVDDNHCAGRFATGLQHGTLDLHLSAGELGLVAQRFQLGRHLVAVIALDLDVAVLDGAARAAGSLQALAQRFRIIRRQLQVLNYGYRLATPPFYFALDVRHLLLWGETPDFS